MAPYQTNKSLVVFTGVARVASAALALTASAWLGAGCGHGGGPMRPAASGKGYPATSYAAPAAPPTPPPPPVTASVPAAPPPSPAPTTIATPTVAPLPPPTRTYEPPMPLEPGRSSSVYQPLPPAPPASRNGANTTAVGLRFTVRGVDPSDVLNIRSGPSAQHDVVGTIPPDGTGVVPVGGRRQIGPSVWREVSYRGVRGWVNDRFLVEENGAR